MCIARFGRLGVDIHHDLAEQMKTGRQCKDCTHGLSTLEDWLRFRDSMAEFDADVGERVTKLIPTRLHDEWTRRECGKWAEGKLLNSSSRSRVLDAAERGDYRFVRRLLGLGYP